MITPQTGGTAQAVPFVFFPRPLARSDESNELTGGTAEVVPFSLSQGYVELPWLGESARNFEWGGMRFPLGKGKNGLGEISQAVFG